MCGNQSGYSSTTSTKGHASLLHEIVVLIHLDRLIRGIITSLMVYIQVNESSTNSVPTELWPAVDRIHNMN